MTALPQTAQLIEDTLNINNIVSVADHELRNSGSGRGRERRCLVAAAAQLQKNMNAFVATIIPFLCLVQGQETIEIGPICFGLKKWEYTFQNIGFNCTEGLIKVSDVFWGMTEDTTRDRLADVCNEAFDNSNDAKALEDCESKTATRTYQDKCDDKSECAM